MKWPFGRKERTVQGFCLPQSQKDVSSGSSTVLGGLAGISPGPIIPPYRPRIPKQPPHIQPLGRPAWWWAALPQSRLIYPDDQLNVLLEELRRTVPILDRAIQVLVELVGKVEFEGGSNRARAEVDDWWRQVKVNQTMRGGQTWIEAQLDMMLLYGKGVGEVVPAKRFTEIYALMNLDPRSIVFQVTDDPLFLIPLQRQHTNAFLQELNFETILTSVNGAHVDTPHGYSLYRSLPFVAQAARVVENATMQVWQRMGAPPIHVNWESTHPNFSDPQGTLAAAALAALRASWNNVMTGRITGPGGSGVNTVSDYFTSGRVKVEVIGHDHTPLPLAETWRVFEEQLVAATGLPSWLLGFHWATTERMALQQSEILFAQIEGLRRRLQPQLEHVIDLRQRFAGKSGRVHPVWSKINLHDAVEQARAKAWNSQARGAEINNALSMWALGFWTQLEAFQSLDPDAIAPAVGLSTPPTFGMPPRPDAGPSVGVQPSGSDT